MPIYSSKPVKVIGENCVRVSNSLVARVELMLSKRLSEFMQSIGIDMGWSFLGRIYSIVAGMIWSSV